MKSEMTEAQRVEALAESFRKNRFTPRAARIAANLMVRERARSNEIIGSLRKQLAEAEARIEKLTQRLAELDPEHQQMLDEVQANADRYLPLDPER